MSTHFCDIEFCLENWSSPAGALLAGEEAARKQSVYEGLRLVVYGRCRVILVEASVELTLIRRAFAFKFAEFGSLQPAPVGIQFAPLPLTAGAAKLGNPRAFPNLPRHSQPAN